MAPTRAASWRRLSLAGVLVLLAVASVIHLQGQAGGGVAPSAKLTTLLADLAQAVAQDSAHAAASGLSARTTPGTDQLPASVRDAIRGRRLRMNASNEVQVYVLMDAVTEANLQQLAAVGVTVEITDAARRRVQARVPTTRLQAVAALPFVTFVRLPSYAVRRIGSVTTEGDAILHASTVRSLLSLDGTGVRVGVLSDGIKGVFASNCTSCAGASGGPIATADLPAATGTRSGSGVLTSSSGGIIGRSFQANNDLEGLPPASPVCGFAGAGAEGTALLEIVHDLAPAAQLSFANADTDLAFNQAVNYLASINDVVVDDLGFYGDANDGTSSVSQNTAAALNNASNPIRAYVTSVGNSADEHYYGTYTASSVDGTSFGGIANPGRVHLFQQSADTTDVLNLGPQPYNVISLPRSGEVLIFLTWDDPFGRAGNNYDLYLVQKTTGQVVARSTDVQNGSQDPVEFIDYTAAAADLFYIVVQNVRDQAQPKHLNLYSFEPECALSGPLLLAAGHHERHEFNTATRSVPAQSDAGGSPVSVISAGAICSASAKASGVFGSATPDESCNDTSNSTIEFFSSLGPTLDGRTKPDVSGIDGVSITAAGSFASPFFGTSAAAPHVAGIAALLLQSAPCLVSGATGAVDTVSARTTLRGLITGGATALGGSAPNNTFGWGRVDALASAQRTLPVYGGGGTLTVSGTSPAGASVSPAQLGFSDPTACPLTRLNWTGGCGTSPGSTMTCPFGTTKVSVAASNNGVGFSAASDIQVTVTNFGVGIAPASATISAGQSVVYQVTVTPQGGAFSSSVTLGCSGLPTGTQCTFSPPTVSPESGSAQSTLTVSTTARSSALGGGAPGRLVGMALMALAGLGVLAAIARRRPARSVATACGAVAVAIALLVTQGACGGGSSSGGSSSNTPPGTPSAVVSPASLTFASQPLQTPSAAQAVTLTSTGTAALTVAAISATGDFAQTSNCGSAVGAGTSCAINVTFTPTAAGSRAGTLTITDNASNSPQTVALTGTGSGGAQSGPTPAGNYQITVTGTSGTLVQSGTLALVVQ